MSDRPRQSRLVAIDHVGGANTDNELNQWIAEMDWFWEVMFSGEYPEDPGERSAVVCPALHAFCEAFERHEANERAAAAARGCIPPGEYHNTALHTPHDAAFHAMGPTNNSYNIGEAVTADTITLNRFWMLLRAQERWHRQEETHGNTFVKAWELLERRQEMADVGMAEMDWFPVLLLREEFAGIFPTYFTVEQWYRLLQANFHEEDCKILFLLDLDCTRRGQL
ncbi:hypothetical protein E4U19_007474 [Claviceps sp. Clav32 group G5]|nr:hypothetical protein E4U19_007474 [Claviceps sp. Clav32 group G5]KAG6043219.1 hypothetical protein E4U39_004803 [Claviceps sp. Clav50 group G5]